MPNARTHCGNFVKLLIIPCCRSESSESVKTVTVTQTVLSSPSKVILSSSETDTSRSSEITSRHADTVTETRTQQRIAQQLEEVRLGIFKLLSDGEDQTVKKISIESAKNDDDLGVAPLDEEETPGYQADEDDDSHDSVSQSVEISTVAPARADPDTGDMGCVSADKDDRADDRATDSGIDRGQGSSRAASAEGWLARLTSRVGVRHHSGGSAVSSPDNARFVQQLCTSDAKKK